MKTITPTLAELAAEVAKLRQRTERLERRCGLRTTNATPEEAEGRIGGLARRRFRFLFEHFTEDTRQEVVLATLLYWQLPDPEFLRAVGRHFSAVARNYGYFRPYRPGNRHASATRREVPSLELTCMEDYCEAISCSLDR